MDFGIIKKPDNTEISLSDWEHIVIENKSLEKIPDVNGVNPFTNHKVVFSGVGKAYYVDKGENAGSLSLEDGIILTTSVPRLFCEQIAQKMGADVFEDDRS